MRVSRVKQPVHLVLDEFRAGSLYKGPLSINIKSSHLVASGIGSTGSTVFVDCFCFLQFYSYIEHGISFLETS